MKKTKLLFAALAGLLALSLLSGCVSMLSAVSSAAAGGASATSAASVASTPPAASAADAPSTSGAATAGGSGWALDINTQALDGTAVTSADFAGNTLTVLNIWATWCPPCVAELPHLQEMSDHFADKGVQMVGVLQDGVTEQGDRDEGIIDDANTLLDDAGASYLVILPDNALVQEFIASMQYFPTTFFLDSEGNVVETVVGSNDAAAWEEIINGVLDKVS